MELPGFRPRYRFSTVSTSTEVTRLIRDRLGSNNPRGLLLRSTLDHLVLTFPQRDSAAWTPQMDISFEALADGKTLVRCQIGPNPTIWMLFAGGYLALVLLALTGLTLGIAQQMAGDAPWGYPMAGMATLAIVIAAVVERTGRKRARPDMHYLSLFMDEALGCKCLELAREELL